MNFLWMTLRTSITQLSIKSEPKHFLLPDRLTFAVFIARKTKNVPIRSDLGDDGLYFVPFLHENRRM